MKDFLKQYLMDKNPKMKEYDDDGMYFWQYHEDVNKDALTEDWLENSTSYIYKVGVLCAIDSNKCDFVHIAIGTQRDDKCTPEIKGSFYFNEGENDDMGRVIKRAIECLEFIHPVFH